MNGFPWLTLLTFTPIVGALSLLAVKSPVQSRRLATAFAFVPLLMVLAILSGFDGASGELQFVERHTWIPTLNVEYFLGVDGLNVVLLLLTAIVTPMALLVSGTVAHRANLYFALILFLQGGLFGAFTALNFFHWFLFWELTLIPAFLLVRFWGGPKRAGASVQFFIYTMFGSIALLLAFLALHQATGTFDLIELAERSRIGELEPALLLKLGWYGMTAREMSVALFVLAFLGFAVKTPLMPFHSWLPATYTEAPTPVTMMLTGLMSKLGVYGFLRLLLPIFPGAMQDLLTPLLWLAVLTIVFSAASALVQTDLKRVLAYSSINHLGYCLLGIFAVASAMNASADGPTERAAALNGVMLQMFNHGLTAATLFAFVHFIEQRAGGLRGLNDFGGVRKVAPVFCGLMGIAVFSSLGLPGLNGFVGEFLIFKGAFALAPWATVLAAAGLLLTALFLLTLMQRVFQGPLNEKWSAFADLTVRERWILGPAIALMFVLGIYPQLLIGLFNATMTQLAEGLRF